MTPNHDTSRVVDDFRTEARQYDGLAREEAERKADEHDDELPNLTEGATE